MMDRNARRERLIGVLPALHFFYATFVLIVGILLISSESSRSAFQVWSALCIRAQTPAPSPNSLPSRTATVGETGLRSLRIS